MYVHPISGFAAVIAVAGSAVDGGWVTLACAPSVTVMAIPAGPEWMRFEIRYSEDGSVWMGGRLYKGRLTAAELSFTDKDGDKWRMSRTSGLGTVDKFVFVCSKPKI